MCGDTDFKIKTVKEVHNIHLLYIYTEGLYGFVSKMVCFLCLKHLLSKNL